MEVFITLVTSLVSTAVGKKYGTNIGIQIGAIIGLLIREYVKRFPSIMPDSFKPNQVEIKQLKADEEENPIFAKIEEYVLKTHTEQMKSMALVFERGALNLELSKRKISVKDVHEGHSIYIYLEDEKQRERSRTNRTIIVESRTASVGVLKSYVEKVSKFTGDFPNVYTVYSPVMRYSGRDNSNLMIHWDRGVSVKSTKTLKNIVLAKSVEKELDFDKFLGDEEWYTKMSIPYRRGYCLYGPPGTGKTSIIRALANQHGLEIYRISLDEIPSDYHLDRLISDIESDGRPHILTFEDIDRSRFFQKLNNPQSESGAKEVSVGCFLNILDGLTGSNGRITFFTINDESALDKCKALFRPGRIDKKIRVPHCDSYQVKQLFMSFFPSFETKVDEDRIKIHISGISPAELVKILYERKKSPEDALLKIYSEKDV